MEEVDLRRPWPKAFLAISVCIAIVFSTITSSDADYSINLDAGPWNYLWFDFISIVSIIVFAGVVILAVILIPYYIRKRIGKESTQQ